MAIDFKKFEGTLPYASELFGVYQPLLGWRSNQARERVERERQAWSRAMIEEIINDLRVRRAIEFEPRPYGPDSDFLPRIPDWVESRAGARVQSAVATFIKDKGREPTVNDWKSILQGVDFQSAITSPSRSSLEDIRQITNLGLVFHHRSKLTAAELRSPVWHTVEGTELMVARAEEVPDKLAPLAEVKNLPAFDLVLHPKSKPLSAELSHFEWTPVEGMDLMIARAGKAPGNLASVREASIAGSLKYMGEHYPYVLQSAFLQKRAKWEKSRHFVDPLANFDLETQQAILSPVGIINLFREYFFEFKSFLGSPVGHVWVSPGGSLELFEVHARRTVEERQVEIGVEVTTRSEKETTEQDELSTAIGQQNARNSNLGVTSSGGVNFGVVQSSTTASMGQQLTHQTSEQTAHKHLRQQSEKLSTEIRRNFKTTFRTSVEVQDTSSRRYVLQNTTDKLVNYELRRKMRQVGVQVQHIGTQLCWQVYVDNPGMELGIPELVHIAKLDDLNTIQPPDILADLEPKETEMTVEFPFKSLNQINDSTHDLYTNGWHSSDNRIDHTKQYRAQPPLDYELSSVVAISIDRVDPQKDIPLVAERIKVDKKTEGKFTITLNRVNFYHQPAIKFTLKLMWEPTEEAKKNIEKENSARKTLYNEQQRRKAHDDYIKAIRERIKLASNIAVRPSNDLREEERTVVFRRLISQLAEADKKSQNMHVTAELIRAIFDVDKMLYFVAQEWWMPRDHYQLNVEASTSSSGEFPTPPPPTLLTEADKVSWGGDKAKRLDNYLITEDSEPARIGASLGWLLQLDGDTHRNAFLNSPWVKAVIPIHPGKEIAALRWLELAHVEGADGLNEDYLGPEPELKGKKIRQVLLALAEEINKNNNDIKNVLATETVFERGFNPLEGGFRATGKPFDTFDQWIEVLPTDQIVAVEYKPDDEDDENDEDDE